MYRGQPDDVLSLFLCPPTACISGVWEDTDLM